MSKVIDSCNEEDEDLLENFPESCPETSREFVVRYDNCHDHGYSAERLQWRKQQIRSLCGSSPQLSPSENGQLSQLLCDFHDVFSLEEGEQGETSLVEFEIDTGESIPKKQPAHRVPYSARQEIAS